MSDDAVVQLQSHSPENAQLWITEIVNILKSLKEVTAAPAAAAAAAAAPANPYAKDNYVPANKAANPYSKQNYYAGGGADKARTTSTDKRVSAVLRARRKQQREAIFAEKVEVDTGRTKIKHAKTAAQETSIKSALENHFLFQNLPESMKQDCVDAMEAMKVSLGEVVIQQGDDGDFFYVVADGTYEIVVSGVIVDSIGEGGNFGELALLYNCPRAATVQAKTTGTLWRLDRQTFRQTLAAAANADQQIVVTALKGAELLKDLESDQVTRLAEVVQPVHFASGEKIINKGDSGSVFYIIKTGTVVCKDIGGGNMNDLRLGPGDYFGERALLMGAPRAANVVAETSCQCMVLDRTSFNEMLGPLKKVLDNNLSYRVLQSVPLLKGLTERERQMVAEHFQPVSFAPGSVIIQQVFQSNLFIYLKKAGFRCRGVINPSPSSPKKLKTTRHKHCESKGRVRRRFLHSEGRDCEGHPRRWRQGHGGRGAQVRRLLRRDGAPQLRHAQSERRRRHG